MVPLSCVNCCHNPLQLGPLGTAFGYCTRHRVVLNQPHVTTCGQLLRKDLLAKSATAERVLHAKTYPPDRVVTVARPDMLAAKKGFAEKANGQQLPADPVVEEAQNYGQLDSKIGTMAALHRIPGARAEVAMLSLSRSYFRNCVSKKGSWTAGMHLLFWTLGRLDQEPAIAATDIRGPIAFSLARTIAVARWTLIAFRLAFIGDVGEAAEKEGDKAGKLALLPSNAVRAVPGINPDGLLAWLSTSRPRWSSALSPHRYAMLKKELHQVEDDKQSQP